MKKYFIIIFLLAMSLPELFSQGCSDAGICSLSANHEEAAEAQPNNTLELGYVYGKGLEKVTYHNGFISYGRNFNKKWNLNLRVTYNQASGGLGSVGAFGDAFLVANYTDKQTEHSAFSYTLGIKFPFSNANVKNNNTALPMDYQPTLGTYDALLGVEYQYNQWNFNAALQLPLLQTNKNTYFAESATANVFPTTNLFQRNADVLLRGTYTFVTSNQHWFFKPNLLALYHVGNDTYEDILGKRQTLSGSAGLTINASIITVYKISEKSHFNLNIATPLLVRKIRPDGLTRAFVTSLSYQYQF